MLQVYSMFCKVFRQLVPNIADCTARDVPQRVLSPPQMPIILLIMSSLEREAASPLNCLNTKAPQCLRGAGQ